MVKPEEGRGSGSRETKSWVDGIKCQLQIGALHFFFIQGHTL